MYLSSGHYTIYICISVAVAVAVSANCYLQLCPTMRVLVPHFLCRAGGDPGRKQITNAACEPFALFICRCFGAHTRCAHRRPIGPTTSSSSPPLPNVWHAGSRDKWPDTIVSLFECYSTCFALVASSAHLHVVCCVSFRCFVVAQNIK